MRAVPTPTPDDARMDGRSIVVTGAGRGIGAATARSVVAFGGRVAICDRDGDALALVAEELRSADGPREGSASLRSDVVSAVLDVRDLEAVGGFAESVQDRFGPVDGVVNNAGGTYRSPFVASSSKGDRALIDENFTSVVSMTRAFLPMLRDGSSIVNVTSSEAFQAAPGFAVYAAMKAAVENLTRTLALELADRSVRVNCVAPDGVRSVGDAALADEVRSDSNFLPPPIPPLGRVADPEECASVILFLLGDLSRFVTGTTIHVDGGLHAAGGWHLSTAGA